jgi:hypothetical protein
MVAEPAAAMQRDHGWKRTLALGLEQLRMQSHVVGGNIDLPRRRQRRRIRGDGRGKQRQEQCC